MKPKNGTSAFYNASNNIFFPSSKGMAFADGQISNRNLKSVLAGQPRKAIYMGFKGCLPARRAYQIRKLRSTGLALGQAFIKKPCKSLIYLLAKGARGPWGLKMSTSLIRPLKGFVSICKTGGWPWGFLMPALFSFSVRSSPRIGIVSQSPFIWPLRGYGQGAFQFPERKLSTRKAVKNFVPKCKVGGQPSRGLLTPALLGTSYYLKQIPFLHRWPRALRWAATWICLLALPLAACQNPQTPHTPNPTTNKPVRAAKQPSTKNQPLKTNKAQLPATRAQKPAANKSVRDAQPPRTKNKELITNKDVHNIQLSTKNQKLTTKERAHGAQQEVETLKALLKKQERAFTGVLASTLLLLVMVVVLARKARQRERERVQDKCVFVRDLMKASDYQLLQLAIVNAEYEAIIEKMKNGSGLEDGGPPA